MLVLQDLSRFFVNRGVQEFSKILNMKDVQSENFFRNVTVIIKDPEDIPSKNQQQNPNLKAAVERTFEHFPMGTKDLSLFEIGGVRSKFDFCSSNLFRSSVLGQTRQDKG